MDIDELRTVQSKERRKDSLQHLRDSFYDDVAAYIAERKAERDERAASVESPFSDSRVRKLSDEIETAEEVAESLYERRVGKVVKLASFSAADAPVDTEGMTTQELDLFEDLVARIRSNKEAVLDVLADGPDAAGDAVPTDADPAGAATDPPESATDGTAGPAADAEDDPADAAAADGAGDVLADAMGGDPSIGTGDEGPSDATGDDRRATDGERSSDPTPATADAGRDGANGTAERDDSVDRPAERDRPSGNRTAEGREETTATPTGGAAGGARGDETGDPPAGTPGAGAGGADGEADASTSGDRTTVRITRDVGEILGVDDREYDLESEDVVSLPAANAGPLVERDAAERLE